MVIFPYWKNICGGTALAAPLIAVLRSCCPPKFSDKENFGGGGGN
jgi:hypothetical protein